MTLPDDVFTKIQLAGDSRPLRGIGAIRIDSFTIDVFTRGDSCGVAFVDRGTFLGSMEAAPPKDGSGPAQVKRLPTGPYGLAWAGQLSPQLRGVQLACGKANIVVEASLRRGSHPTVRDEGPIIHRLTAGDPGSVVAVAGPEPARSRLLAGPRP